MDFEKLSKIFVIIGLAILLISIVFFLKGENIMNWESQIKANKFSQFGDFIGGLVGSFWALSGILLIYSALIEQRKSLKIQEEEIRIQKEEAKKNYEAQLENQKALMEQIEQMKSTTKLQSLHSLYSYFNQEYGFYKAEKDKRLTTQYDERRRRIIKEIDKIYNSILNDE